MIFPRGNSDYYHKYRPCTFDEVVGHQSLINSIRKIPALENASRTLLFYGVSGSGKTSTARILAAALNCENVVNDNPCCSCPSCLSIMSASSPDFYEINASDNRGIDDIRSIKDNMLMSPMALRNKVYILDECYPGETLVMVDYDLALPIRDVVNNTSITEVLSYDLEQKRIVKNKITKRHCRPYHDKLVTIKVKGKSISCTRRQELYVLGKGMVPAEEIKSGDRLIQYTGSFEVKRVCADCGEILEKKNLAHHKMNEHLEKRPSWNLGTAQIRECLSCGGGYTGSNKHYCSWECYCKANGCVVGGKWGPCQTCGKEMYLGEGHKFCSFECYTKSNVGKPRSEECRNKISKKLKEFRETPEGICMSLAQKERQIGLNNTIFRYMTPSEVSTCFSSRQKKWWSSLCKEERERRIKIFIDAPKYRKLPNKLEHEIIDFNVFGLEFVGDGSFFITFEPTEVADKEQIRDFRGTTVWNKNPDFVYKENGVVTKIVELMDFEFWHSEKEAQFVKKMYRDLGYECLIVDASRMKKEAALIKGEIEAFCNNHYTEVEDVHVGRSSCSGSLVYDLTVENTHNFFVVTGDYSYGSGPNREGYCSNIGEPILSSNCHSLTKDAQQSLLKVLEEAPSNVYIILCSTEPQKLLETVKNRCQKFNFKALDRKYIEELIEQVATYEGLSVDKAVVNKIVDKSNGSPRNALVFLQQIFQSSSSDVSGSVDDILMVVDESSTEAIDVCRALANQNSKWSDISDLISGLSIAPEAVRLCVLGYFRSMLLGCKVERLADKYAYVMDMFMVPFYDVKPENGLVLALFKAHKMLKAR